jgi:hypothetical protein
MLLNDIKIPAIDSPHDSHYMYGPLVTTYEYKYDKYFNSR